MAANGCAKLGKTAGMRDGVAGIIMSGAKTMNSDSQWRTVSWMISSVLEGWKRSADQYDCPNYGKSTQLTWIGDMPQQDLNNLLVVYRYALTGNPAPAPLPFPILFPLVLLD